jgi:ubiquinone/menaquinone biosynthesis C-methylase UbiE
VVVAQVFVQGLAMMTLDQIKQYWEQVGNQFPRDGSITPTNRDPYLGQLEEENILSYLEGQNDVLEIGCGDGAHAIRYGKCVKQLSAIDIAESLIRLARDRAKAQQTANVRFTVGSVLALREVYQAGQFNCVVSQRCLINLPQWEYQREALIQVHEVLKKGGLFLLSEGFQEGLDNLNAARREVGLEEMRVVHYNRNMRRQEFESWVAQRFDTVEIRDYGTYLFLSRIFHPLAVLPDAPKHDARLNKAAMELARRVPVSELQKYSYNLFYALKKK